MSDITKRVNRGIPCTQRTQSFTELDAGAGDVLMIEASLGHPAHILTVESAGGMSLRLNVHQTVYPNRQGGDLMWTEHMPNLALGQNYKDNSMALIDLVSGETMVFDDGTPVKDLEIVTVAGSFEILAV